MGFWRSENGKIIGHLIHDTNSETGIIKYYLKDLKDENYKHHSKEELFNNIDKYMKKIRDSVDSCYKQFKEQYDKQQIN
jgi:hypothetical protein